MPQIDTLIESFTFGFGRVNELLTGGFGVKYSNREALVYYSNADLENKIITIHE